MPRVDFERTERYFHGLNAEKFQPILATNSNGLTNSRQCSVCVQPREAFSNACRVLWTPDNTQVYWSDLPSWTGNINLTYPTAQVSGNGVYAGSTPFDYTIGGTFSNELSFDHEQLTLGPMFRDTTLNAFTMDNPAPIAWIMEDNPCEEYNTIIHESSVLYDLGSTDITIPDDIEDVHATNAGIRVAYGPTVALKIRENITVTATIRWDGDSGGAASNHLISINVVVVSSIVERWSVTARSSGGSFGEPLICTFSIEDLQVGPNNSYQLDADLSWVDSSELPSFYEGATGDLSRPVTGGGPTTAIVGDLNDIGGGVYRRTPSGTTDTTGTLDGDDPGNILWSNDAPN